MDITTVCTESSNKVGCIRTVTCSFFVLCFPRDKRPINSQLYSTEIHKTRKANGVLGGGFFYFEIMVFCYAMLSYAQLCSRLLFRHAPLPH